MRLLLGLVTGGALAALVGTVGCSASGEASPEADSPLATSTDLPEALQNDGTPADRPAPQASVRQCGGAAGEASRLRVYNLVPETRPIALGQAVIDGVPAPTAYAQGDLEQEAPTPAITGYFAGPDATSLAGWLGANALLTYGGDEAHDNFVSRIGGLDPLSAWANAQKPSKRRVTFSVAFNEEEYDWHFAPDTEARAPGAPQDPNARFVRWFRGHRFFGATLGFDFPSDCAVGAVADVLGKVPVVKNGAPNPDPWGKTLLDPERRTRLEEVLVREGVHVFVSLVSNRPRPEVVTLAGASRCSAADLGACSKLVDDLTAALHASVPKAPTRYEELTRNAGEWSVTAYAAGKLSQLR